MPHNKSIDGLATHDAKVSASRAATVKKIPVHTVKTSVKTTPAKPVAKKPVVKKPTPPQITDLEIEVTSDLDAATAKAAKAQARADFLSPVQAFVFDSKSGELTESESTVQEIKRSTKSHKTSKKPHKVRRAVITVLLVILIILTTFLVCMAIWGNDIIAKITGGQGTIFDLLTFTDETYEPLKTDSKGRTNLLAFGTEGYDMAGTASDGGTHAGAQLTDSIMVISLNQNTGDIAMISLPRDLKASPTCTATGKINEVYWCNNIYGDDDAAGAAALMTEVGSILGIDIQYYTHLNWGSLVSIVNTLGGINVTLDEDIYDYYYTGAVYEAGTTYTLDGEQALGLARARHGTTGGDFTRGTSQQKIIIGIKDKIFEKQLSITDLLSLAGTLGDNLRTNLNVSELKTAAHLTSSFDFNSMRTVSLWPDYMTTGMLNGISYVYPRAGVGNYGVIQEYVAKMLSNDPRDYEGAEILVLNATGELGLASRTRDELISAGFHSVDVGDTDETFYQDYQLYILNTNVPATAKALEDHYGIIASPTDSLPGSISRDYDLVLILGPTPLETAE